MRLRQLPTAPFAAVGLIAGFGVALAADSRPAGGAVLAGFALVCVAISAQRDPRAVTAKLAGIGLGMFVISHGLGLVIGAWPAVVVSAGITALACDRLSDARTLRAVRAAA